MYIYDMGQHTAPHCNTLQHTATHCNTLQHTARHCNAQLVPDTPLSWIVLGTHGIILPRATV